MKKKLHNCIAAKQKMIVYNPFDIVFYAKEYEQIKTKLEKSIKEKLFVDLLSQSQLKFTDKQNDNKEIEWSPENSAYTYDFASKYIYSIVIDKIDTIGDIKFWYKQVNRNKICKRIFLTMELDPELYNQIYELIEKYSNSMEEFNKLRELNKNITAGINFFKNNYPNDKLNLQTNLYRHYYKHIDKIIEFETNFLDEFNCSRPILESKYEQFYNWIADKYFIDKNNFKLDYFQSFMKNFMSLDPDYNVIDDLDFVIALENSNSTLKIKYFLKRYINTYQPKYEVFIKNKLTGLESKIGYTQFDTDRRLDLFYSNMLEYIFNTVKLIDKFK